MIVTALLNLIYGVVVVITSPLRLLPDATLPSGVASALSSAGGYASSLDAFVPVSTIYSVVLAMLVVEGFILTYKTLMWALKKIPGIN
jgi:hypothetical protein